MVCKNRATHAAEQEERPDQTNKNGIRAPKHHGRKKRKPGRGPAQHDSHSSVTETMIPSWPHHSSLDLYCEQKSSHPHDGTRNAFAKEWYPVFLKSRNLGNDVSFVQSRRLISKTENSDNDASSVESTEDVDAQSNGIGIFLRDFEDTPAKTQVDELEDFCHKVNLQDLKTGTCLSGYRRAVWIDDRQFSRQIPSGYFREYQNPLTATSLYRELEKPRFRDEELPDANRRLIYIRNVDPLHVLALAETAPAHQVLALRDAIGKHLARQTSVRVHIRTKDYTSFQLDLHIPYFEFRRQSPASKENDATGKSLTRHSTDLSFLDMSESKCSGKRRNYAIQKACFSLVICGWDETHYVGYAFVKRHFDEDDNLEDLDFTYQGVHEDPIASDGGEGVIDANLPIWNPRAYFLMIFKLRIAKVLKEWTDLARTIGKGIDSYESRHSLAASPDSKSSHDVYNEEEAFPWSQNTMQLLGQLLPVLSETVRAWDMFRSPDGDKGYFDHINSSPTVARHVRESLQSINDDFETLKSIERDLISLKERCQNSAEALNLRLAFESGKATQHTVSTAEWTISIFSPFALAFAYFSMPQAAIPFKVNFGNFAITFLVVAALVQVLFFVFGGRAHRTWLWKSTAMEVKAKNGSQSSQSPQSKGDHFSHLLAALFWRRQNPDHSLSDVIEMDRRV